MLLREVVICTILTVRAGAGIMRLTSDWQKTWELIVRATNRAGVQQIRLGGELADVVRIGRGEPIVLVPGMAGSWKLVMPLARKLAKHFEVITYSLRGDRFPRISPSGTSASL